MKKTSIVFILTIIISFNIQSQTKAEYINQPAAVNEYNSKEFTLDFLEHNPKFLPGINDFFLNKDKKARVFKLSQDIKYFECNDESSPKIVKDTSSVFETLKKKSQEKQKVIYYFDIKNNEIVAIYQQCLP